MESEAELGSGLLGTEVSHRRRATSVTEDYSVQKTNDDATEAKYLVVQVKINIFIIFTFIFCSKSTARMSLLAHSSMRALTMFSTEIRR